MLSRRHTTALMLMGTLVGCTGTPNDQFAQAKAYIDDAIAAALVGAQQYVADPVNKAHASVVQALADRLEQLKPILDQATEPATWKAGASEALALLQQASPFVAPFLGSAFPLLGLAIAIGQSFIAGLPPPVAPQTPPAALHRVAAQYHRRR